MKEKRKSASWMPIAGLVVLGLAAGFLFCIRGPLSDLRDSTRELSQAQEAPGLSPALGSASGQEARQAARPLSGTQVRSLAAKAAGIAEVRLLKVSREGEHWKLEIRAGEPSDGAAFAAALGSRIKVGPDGLRSSGPALVPVSVSSQGPPLLSIMALPAAAASRGHS